MRCLSVKVFPPGFIHHPNPHRAAYANNNGLAKSDSCRISDIGVYSVIKYQIGVHYNETRVSFLFSDRLLFPHRFPFSFF